MNLTPKQRQFVADRLEPVLKSRRHKQHVPALDRQAVWSTAQDRAPGDDVAHLVLRRVDPLARIHGCVTQLVDTDGGAHQPFCWRAPCCPAARLSREWPRLTPDER